MTTPEAEHPSIATGPEGDPDVEAVRAVASGSPGSLERLAERHERTMLGLALALTSHRHDVAIEIVQEVWVRVLRSAGTFRATGTVKAWLAKLTVNAARDRLRRDRVRSRFTSFRLARPDDHEAAGQSADTNVHRDDLAAALAHLPERSREIVLLCHCRSLTHTEAARALDIPLGTLKSRLTGAMRTLRAALEPDAAPDHHGDQNHDEDPSS